MVIWVTAFTKFFTIFFIRPIFIVQSMCSIKVEVEDRLDHKNLNLDVKYFSDINPTAENICVYIYKLLRNKIENDLKISVILFETPRNFVKYPAD